MREDKPTRLGDAVGRFLARSGIGERIEATRVIPEWEELVGEGIAEVTTPLRVSGGILLVAVRSSAWLMELKMMEREILRKVNEGRERGRIEGIRFVLGGT